MTLAVTLLVACGDATDEVDPRRAVPSGTPAATEAPGAGDAADAEAVQSALEDAADSLAALGYVDYSPEGVDLDEGEGVVLHDRERAQPGYNLLVSIPVCTARLFDNDGRIVKVWQDERDQDEDWHRVQLMENGDVLVLGQSRPEPDAEWDMDGVQSGIRGFVRRLTWDGELVWNRAITAHHDLEITPEGKLLTLTEHVRHHPADPPGVDVVDHHVALLSPDGELLEEVSIFDALVEVPGLLRRIFDKAHAPQGPFDVLHANSARWMRYPELAERHPLYGPRNVLVSLRRQDLIFVIDMDTRSVVWSWRGETERQHDASVLPDGTILLFDNGFQARGWSRVLEVDPLTKEIVWSYKAPNPEDFYAPARGTVQRLAGGNVLVGDSYAGRAFEIDRSGRTVWRFVTTDVSPAKLERRTMGGRASLRIERYDPDLVEELLSR